MCLALTALTACASLPAEADPALKSALSEYCDGGSECRDYKQLGIRKMDLPNAVKLNGIEGMWCIDYNLTTRGTQQDIGGNMNTDWRDLKGAIIIGKRDSGEYYGHVESSDPGLDFDCNYMQQSLNRG